MTDSSLSLTPPNDDYEDSQFQDDLLLVNKFDKSYHRAPKRFVINVDSINDETQGPQQSIISYACPGSTIEGTVTVDLGAPFSALHLRLFFFADEIIKNGKNPDYKTSMFSIHRILWGRSKEESKDQWHWMDTGVHSFPFVVQLPFVNYSPSLSHSMVSSRFSVFASLERPGMLPFHTQHKFIQFTPTIIPACGSHYPPWSDAFDMKLKQTSFTIQASVEKRVVVANQLEKSVLNPNAVLPIRVAMLSKSPPSSLETLPCIMLEASLKRDIQVAHITRDHHDTQTISQKVVSWDPCNQPTFSFFLSVAMNTPTLPAPLGRADLIPTIDYSSMFNIRYSLHLIFKIKSFTGLVTTQRHHAVLPVFVANHARPPKLSSTSCLLPFTHSDVTQSSSSEHRPQFVSPTPTTVYLPAYDEDVPPCYHSTV
ncbi:hypothetical protein DM01DRAFT_1382751 [Hesseltinella vesiculosa]|uniref:Arrestin-like N-terminal domain-containing protein n=1 Tax=Hesseltinella vesiculosa TaxID=101127 RepID=A0A1X2GJU6_9FUNG|nr:hypothetical protein DM01DRAFT_1382751 [Hesseltinella vesiculosa]